MNTHRPRPSRRRPYEFVDWRVWVVHEDGVRESFIVTAPCRDLVIGEFRKAHPAVGGWVARVEVKR